MARTRLPALTLGLAVASFTLGVAGSSTARAQPADPQTAPAPGADPNQVAPPPPPPAPGQPGLAPPPYYQPAPGDLQPYPQQPYPDQPSPQQPQQPPPPPYYSPQPYPQQSPPPYYGQPPPYPQQPTYIAPNYPSRRVRGYTDRFRPQFGLGMRVSGVYSGSELAAYGAQGIGAELLFRVHPRWTLEMQIQYQRVSSVENYGLNTYFDRFDVPVLGGARLHLGNPFGVFSPYLVGAAGATYSQLTYDLGLADESRWFFEAQGGLGLELRLGKHFMLDVDLRGFGRLRNQSGTDVLVQDYTGNYVRALGNSGGIQFNFGFAGLF